MGTELPSDSIWDAMSRSAVLPPLPETADEPPFISQWVGRCLLVGLAVAVFPAVWLWNRARGERVRW